MPNPKELIERGRIFEERPASTTEKWIAIGRTSENEGDFRARIGAQELALATIPRELPASPMVVLTIGIEHALDVGAGDVL
jgi:hypothetical protein